MFTKEDAINGLKRLAKSHPHNVKICEKIFRLETAHFTSEQYKNCGSAGMEVGKWANLPVYKGVYTTRENGTGIYKSFIIWLDVYQFLVYLSDYIDRHNGNYARWYSTNVFKQIYYRTILAKIKNRIVMLIFLSLSNFIFSQNTDTINYKKIGNLIFKNNRVVECNFTVTDSCIYSIKTSRTALLKAKYKFCKIDKKIKNFDFGHLIPASMFFCNYNNQILLNTKDNVTYQNSVLNRTIIKELEFFIKRNNISISLIKITILYKDNSVIPRAYLYKIQNDKERSFFYFENKTPILKKLLSYKTTENYYYSLILKDKHE
jgi:hypothetical protein